MPVINEAYCTRIQALPRGTWAKGVEISRTHDLPLLNNSCRSYEPSFDSIEDECLNLTDFGVNIRYPYHLDLNETDVDRAFEER